MKPTPAKPRIIIAHVEGSGTAPPRTILPGVRLSLADHLPLRRMFPGASVRISPSKRPSNRNQRRITGVGKSRRRSGLATLPPHLFQRSSILAVIKSILRYNLYALDTPPYPQHF